MIRLLIATAGIFTLTGPDAILLGPSQTTIIRFADDQSHWSAERSTDDPAPPLVNDQATRFQSEPDAAKKEMLHAVPLDSSLVKRGQIRFGFAHLRGRPGMMLFIANGYRRPLVYHAALHRGQDRRETTVCTVAADAYGVEIWPYALDAVELRDFTLLDASTPAPVCN